VAEPATPATLGVLVLAAATVDVALATTEGVATVAVAEPETGTATAASMVADGLAAGPGLGVVATGLAVGVEEAGWVTGITTTRVVGVGATTRDGVDVGADSVWVAWPLEGSEEPMVDVAPTVSTAALDFDGEAGGALTRATPFG
jgi:hypothetical protein